MEFYHRRSEATFCNVCMLSKCLAKDDCWVALRTPSIKLWAAICHVKGSSHNRLLPKWTGSHPFLTLAMFKPLDRSSEQSGWIRSHWPFTNTRIKVVLNSCDVQSPFFLMATFLKSWHTKYRTTSATYRQTTTQTMHQTWQPVLPVQMDQYHWMDVSE